MATCLLWEGEREFDRGEELDDGTPWSVLGSLSISVY